MLRTEETAAGGRWSEHHEAFIDACVQSGRYRDGRDVVEAALRLLEEREARFGASCAEMTRGVDELFGDDPSLAELVGRGPD